ncbi:MAG: transporter substrate-binding domain-containing protein, partial [Lentisphaerae bacterium]|nr:transporter substrate-binding domain-containing protein [Lentisphaerota bacterium]
MRLQTSWLAGRLRGGGRAVSWSFLILVLALALALALALIPASRAAAPEPPTPLVVLCDDNYPPYSFRDSAGRLQGIISDQWALWERQTGVTVEVRGMPWSEALRRMQAGQGDVIDTIFFSARRARSFIFTKPYARIEVSVFTHRSLEGIDDVRGLRGFAVGVKAGDVAVERLRNQGVDGLRIYPSYEAIILAAKEDGLRAFCIDRPPAIHYLYKHEISHEFREAFVFTVGAFHRAVRQGQPDLLKRVQSGFDGIPRRDYEAIERRWRSAPLRLRPLLSQWWRWIVGVGVGVLVLLHANVILSRRVRARTQDLRQAMEDLRQSLDAQAAADAELRASQQYLAAV